MKTTTSPLFTKVTFIRWKLTVILILTAWLFAPLWLRAQSVEMRAHIIDVGQANAFLLEFPCGAVLIDAGTDDSDNNRILVDYLTKVFATRPDLHNTIESLFLTHPHIDHTRALKPVIEHFTVKRFIDDGLNTGSGKAQVKWVRDNARTDGRSITVKRISDPQAHANTGLTDGDIDPISCSSCDPKITVLAGGKTTNPGWSTKAFGNENNHSLVIRVDFGHASFLFTGDLEAEGIQTLLTKYSAHPDLLDTDVYFAGHHGSHNGTTTAFLNAMTPNLAIISVGFWRDGFPSQQFTTYAYGHPRASLVTMLGSAISETRSPAINPRVASGARNFAPKRVTKNIYATGWDGNIIVKAKLDGTLTVTRKN